MQVYDSLAEVIGGTPLVRLQSVTRGIAKTRDVLVKVEYLNPGGSVKDRIALRMIESAEREGKLAAGGTIIEPTSGNTGVGLAIVANNRGYKCVFVCPDKVAQDKISVLRAYGADVVVCPSTVSPDHPDSYYSVARRLARETPGAWQPDQYANPDNPAAHYHSTGPEIWAADGGEDNPPRGRHRHRRHDLRHRPVPEGEVRQQGTGHRRGPGGLGVLRRRRPPLPRGRRWRGHLARPPTTGTSPTR